MDPRALIAVLITVTKWHFLEKDPVEVQWGKGPGGVGGKTFSVCVCACVCSCLSFVSVCFGVLSLCIQGFVAHILDGCCWKDNNHEMKESTNGFGNRLAHPRPRLALLFGFECQQGKQLRLNR